MGKCEQRHPLLLSATAGKWAVRWYVIPQLSHSTCFCRSVPQPWVSDVGNLWRLQGGGRDSHPEPGPPHAHQFLEMHKTSRKGTVCLEFKDKLSWSFNKKRSLFISTLAPSFPPNSDTLSSVAEIRRHRTRGWERYTQTWRSTAALSLSPAGCHTDNWGGQTDWQTACGDSRHLTKSHPDWHGTVSAGSALLSCWRGPFWKASLIREDGRALFVMGGQRNQKGEKNRLLKNNQFCYYDNT